MANQPLLTMKHFEEGIMKKYEEISIEIILLNSEDIITTSAPFDGEDDIVKDWT